jgi:hypothetical protein
MTGAIHKRIVYHPTTQQASAFFRVPSMIHVEIYRKVLLIHQNLDYRVILPPPLTQVCRQIRKETLQIHHNENVSVANVHNVDVVHGPSSLSKWLEIPVKHDLQPIIDFHIDEWIRVHEVLARENLMRWLKRYYYHKIDRPTPSSERDGAGK